MPLRVMHVCETVPGGPASYLRELVPLQQREYGAKNIALVVPGVHLSFISEISNAELFLWARTGRNAYSLLNLARSLWSSTTEFKPDVIHLHSTFAGFVGRIVCALHPHRSVVVYCAHGWSFSMEVSTFRKRIFRQIERILSFFNDGIINISEHESNIARIARLNAANQRTILNGISETVSVEAEKDNNDGKINLLFVGRHDPQKGLDVLIDAISQIDRDSIVLNVVGDAQVSPGKLGASRSPNIRFLGWSSREQVFRHISQADAVVMPSRWEGFGLVAIEAFRAGVPVLASNRGALPEIVKDGKTGYIFEPVPAILADLLRRIDKSELLEMGIAAKLDFRDRFTSSRMYREIDEFYKELVVRRVQTEVRERSA